jgi:hypothetical protein
MFSCLPRNDLQYNFFGSITYKIIMEFKFSEGKIKLIGDEVWYYGNQSPGLGEKRTWGLLLFGPLGLKIQVMRPVTRQFEIFDR